MRGRGRGGGGGNGSRRGGGGGVGENARKWSGEEGTDELVECFNPGGEINREVPVRGGRGGGREAEVPDRELREAGLGKRIREFDDER